MYIISTPAGYVARFSPSHQTVQIAQTKQCAKQFSMAEARKFIANYSDAGYGLTTATAAIIPA